MDVEVRRVMHRKYSATGEVSYDLKISTEDMRKAGFEKATKLRTSAKRGSIVLTKASSDDSDED
ncbi:MAG: hypothetical protein KGI07_09760 [Thaumarchaeota archaeon]|nr:hypothetical protein [Nitrososphaerota archaeon]